MERSSTISSGRSCWELSRLLPFHSRLPRTRQGPLRVGSVRRAPCESRIVIDERIYRSGSLAVSCLAYCGLLVCFDLNFNFGPLFQACFPAFVVRQSVLNANLPIQIISFLNAEFPLFRAVSDKQAL